MHSFGIGIDCHVISSNKILQNFVIGSDHSASIDEVEIRYRVINLEDVRFELACSHNWYVLYFIGGSFESDDFEFVASLHIYNN